MGNEYLMEFIYNGAIYAVAKPEQEETMKTDRTKRQIELRLDTIQCHKEKVIELEEDMIYYRDHLIKDLQETEDPRLIAETIMLYGNRITNNNRMIDHKKDRIAYEYERIMEILKEDERTKEIFKASDEKE